MAARDRAGGRDRLSGCGPTSLVPAGPSAFELWTIKVFLGYLVIEIFVLSLSSKKWGS